MKVIFNEIKFTIKKASENEKHPNLLAFITLRFEEKNGGYFILSGFTLWRSKFGGYHIEVPNKPGFKYCLISRPLWKEIEQKITRQYDYESIPVIEEEKE